MKITSTTLLLGLCFCLPLAALGQDGSSVTQTLTVEVKPITKIAVTGNPGPLFITDASAGSEESSVSDNSTKYSMLTNLDNMKIVASINTPMPHGTKLMVKLESGAGLSNGFVDVSSAMTPVEVVTGIGKGSDLNRTISYAFAANSTVGQIAADSRVVTLTLTN